MKFSTVAFLASVGHVNAFSGSSFSGLSLKASSNDS
eukprot:CAMPEP_0170780268 /NCGR_PEP_ID=MMETSP0733-20121128/13479_1 /TAXON_ID=186038 /ORGANISM="Fragilariopsis kerguelensis, Strain L26-C5" /LENGTH=35 /DNA_ID= /DNA_START= /DNA_END= /DNA_ORIENTATION=